MTESNEDQTDLLPVEADAGQELMTMDEAEDSRLAGVIKLPTFTDVTDKQVLKNVRDVFKGFDPDTGNSGAQFEDVNALATYAQNSMEDICNIRKTADANQLCYKAAAMARFWYLGNTIDKALNNGNYGTAAVAKLAAALKMSQPYVYQIRAVATKLTVTDCYLLGIRGLDSTHLRKLSQVKDDAVRRAIVDAFIEAYQDTSDPKKTESAKKALVAAVNASRKTQAVDVNTSDPMNGGSEIDVSVEYTEAMDFLEKVSKNAKALSEEELSENAVRAFDYFFLADDVPDAQKHLDEVRDKADEVEKRLRLVVANANAMIESLVSLKGVELTAKK